MDNLLEMDLFPGTKLGGPRGGVAPNWRQLTTTQSMASPHF
jgi:hypothetical protein